MISAIIDLGSNTIRLCVYEHNENEVKTIFEKKEMAGLVNYVENEKLSKQGIDKACEILSKFIQLLNNLHVDETNVHIFATASLRNIVNTKEVIEAIKSRTRLQVELLSGDEEATLDFIGTTKCLDMENGVIIDVGGGSTEIVIFENNSIRYATSIPIGSLNMYVRFVKKIIPKKEEREMIRQTVLNHLTALDVEYGIYPTICGIGGTIRGISKLNNSIYNLPVDNTDIDTSHVKEILASIKNSHRDTLSPILRNVPDRIHTIVPGMIIIDTIADFFQSENIILSKYGIREGYLYERIIKGE
ncbi:MAG TPA: phosphatase [Mobilitalea sp.]|nr:phosphatase [Mobilitalea sp.]